MNDLLWLIHLSPLFLGIFLVFSLLFEVFQIVRYNVEFCFFRKGCSSGMIPTIWNYLELLAVLGHNLDERVRGVLSVEAGLNNQELAKVAILVWFVHLFGIVSTMYSERTK